VIAGFPGRPRRFLGDDAVHPRHTVELPSLLSVLPPAGTRARDGGRRDRGGEDAESRTPSAADTAMRREYLGSQVGKTLVVAAAARDPETGRCAGSRKLRRCGLPRGGRRPGRPDPRPHPAVRGEQLEGRPFDGFHVRGTDRIPVLPLRISWRRRCATARPRHEEGKRVVTNGSSFSGRRAEPLHRAGDVPDAAAGGEGVLTKARASIINNRNLGRSRIGSASRRRCRSILRSGEGGPGSPGRWPADAVEAVIGAIFLDGGHEPALRFVRSHFRLPDLLGALVEGFDAKSRLQSGARREHLPLPAYTLLSADGRRTTGSSGSKSV